MDNHESSSSRRKNCHEHQTSVSSFPSSSSDINSYFHKASNPIRIRQKIDEVSMDQMESWAHIKRLEERIEKARIRLKKQAVKSCTKNAVVHKRNIEELIDGLSKDEARSKMKRGLN